MIWHSSSIEEIKKELDFNETEGLTGAQVAQRIKKYGENRATPKKGHSFAKEFRRRLLRTENFLLALVSLVLIVTGIIGAKALWYAPIIILLLIAGNAALGALATIRNDKQTKELRDKVSVSAKVLREGKVVQINAALLVPGDIVLLEAGDYIPADGRLLEENSLICDESALTGDSAPNEKNTAQHPEDICPLSERHNMVYSGCSVTYGKGVMVVTDIGQSTELGKLYQLSEQTEGSDTATKRWLADFGRSAGIATLVFSAIIFLLSVILIKPGEGESFSDLVFGSLVLALSLYAIALPSALPRTVSSAISFAVKGMLGRNAIVRNPQTVETLGRVSVIISDKTGTLTRNRMKMTSVWSGNEITDLYVDAPDENDITLIRTGALCCNGKIAFGASGKERHFGDPTEVGIVAACQNYCGLSKDELENIYPRMADVPFDSKRKLMTTVNMINNRPFAIVKGAPDILLSHCRGGNIKGAAEAAVTLGQAGQRVIGVAIKPLEEVPSNPNPDNLECDLTLLGLFGMTDSLSHSTRESLSQCKEAGIRVVMVTGDHITTAVAVATELGILTDGQKAVTGDQLDAMTDEELKEEIKNISVYSRISDSEKIRIVRAWQSLGETVALTGDSVEDAAALKEADIGCAMGITGTDISKGSADIVLSDDSFISIVNAVKTGRSAFYNIRHSVQLFLACVIGQILSLVLGLIIFKAAVIPAAGILFINTILMLGLSRSLTAEPDRKNSLKVPPRKKKEGVFAKLSDLAFLWQGVLLAAFTLIAYAISSLSITAFTVFAICLVCLTLALKNCRDFYHEGIHIEKNMFIGLGFGFISVLLIILTPLANLFSFGGANGTGLGMALLFGVALLVICEVVKFIRLITEK